MHGMSQSIQTEQVGCKLLPEEEMDANFEIHTRNKSIQCLPQALLSLIGSKNNLTPCWVESVSDIINDLQSAQKVGYPILKEEIQEKMERLSSVDGEVEASVSKIEDELSSLNAQLDELMVQRRDVLNEYLDLKGNIRVFCRIRPFLPLESFPFQKSIFDLDSSNVFMRIAETKCKKYNFDKVFPPSSTQEEVFSEIEPVIKSALDGYNVCIFAYGQTGTGKTYTMDGKPHNPGMVPRGIKSMFNQAEERNCEFIFTFSMLEIYMGNLKDLLAPAKKSNFQKPPCLKIKTDSDGDIDVENMVAIQVNNFDQVKKLYDIGTRLRSTGSTMANSTSSRSHCLIRITLTSIGARERIREKNKLWMVDLGGSERLLKTQASGKRLEEGKAINLSLSALADVIDALQTKKAHVPFRNSKLTQVLRDSLGSDSKTLMLVHASPNENDLCETICTFGFAMRVRSIRFEKEEEPIEVRAKKEQSIADVEQEMKQLEKESQELQMKIKVLNEKLQELKGVQISDADSNFSYTCSEGIGISQNFTKTSSRVPGFMKPTACSQRKTESHQTSLNKRRKKPPVPSKKRPASVYAESLIYPVKEFTCKSDCASECSISTLEYEVKQVIFPEEEKSPRNGNSVEEKETERLLSVQVVELSSNYNQWNKRVMSIPIESWNKNNVDDISKDVIEKSDEKEDMEFQEEKSKQGINNKACCEENDINITSPVPVNSKYYQEENSDEESGTNMSVIEMFLEYEEEMLPGERKDTEVEMEETKLENEIGNISNA
ncbi:kinesin KP1 isoform X2 [Carex littledalei]|uniref:Kinesin KP1 isoform X2 n=1 Tax=Carex littledalei TaxID=544730 RepID=A0A833QYK1_9POAL|nr:kinesin KP1 isoform X2 [Carex littledalei]